MSACTVFIYMHIYWASQVALVVKNLPANAGDVRKLGFDPWVGKMPWRRVWHPLQYSCLENPMDKGPWRATVCWVSKSQTLTHDIIACMHPLYNIYMCICVYIYIYSMCVYIYIYFSLIITVLIIF